MAAFDAGFHLLVFIALVNTVISLYYYLLIVKAMYITPSENPIPTFRSDRCTKWGLALCTLGIIGLGIASVVYQSIDKLAFGNPKQKSVCHFKVAYAFLFRFVGIFLK